MWEYRATVIKVLDGDTLRMLVDVGFSVRREVDIRLLGVHAPEKNQPGGKETRQFVEQWVSDLDPDLRWPVFLQTSKSNAVEPQEQMTFTRYVGIVIAVGPDFPDRDLNDEVNVFLAGHPEWGSGI